MTGPIFLEAVSKCYRIFDSPRDRLKQAFRDRFRLFSNKKGSVHFREHWALRDISFELQAGEAVGILGRNGAGKSTLLQIIAGTLEPSAGVVSTSGRVMALLELGSGFNMEFTGLENVRLNAQILGLSPSEIDDKMDEIVAFADIGDFIEQPVKIYSTGMLMRVAFAVQTVLDPDILIVDEALSVGDARFQEKCFRKLRNLRESGTTILLVSHDINAVTSFCDRALLIETGELVASGSSAEISKVYLRRLYGPEPQIADTAEALMLPCHTSEKSNIAFTEVSARAASAEEFEAVKEFMRFGTGAVKILEASLYDTDDRVANIVVSGQSYRVSQRVLVRTPIAAISSGFIIRNQRGMDIFGITNQTCGVRIENLKPGDILVLNIQIEAWLAAGDYFLQAANAGVDGSQYDCHVDAFHFKVVSTPQLFTTSIVNLNPKLSFVVSSTNEAH